MTNKQVYIHRQIGTLGLAATHFLKEQYNTRTIVIGTIVLVFIQDFWLGGEGGGGGGNM